MPRVVVRCQPAAGGSGGEAVVVPLRGIRVSHLLGEVRRQLPRHRRHVVRALYIDDHAGQFRARLWERDLLVSVAQEGDELFAGDASPGAGRHQPPPAPGPPAPHRGRSRRRRRRSPSESVSECSNPPTGPQEQVRGHRRRRGPPGPGGLQLWSVSSTGLEPVSHAFI